MSKTRYTFEAFKTFILTQKDERVVAMEQTAPCDGPIGCLLVQFGRRLFKKKIMSVGYTFINMKNRVAGPVDTDENVCYKYIQECVARKVKNYKEAKELLPKE